MAFSSAQQSSELSWIDLEPTWDAIIINTIGNSLLIFKEKNQSDDKLLLNQNQNYYFELGSCYYQQYIKFI